MLKKLPIEKDIETKRVLKKLVSVHRALAELKGVVSIKDLCVIHTHLNYHFLCYFRLIF